MAWVFRWPRRVGMVGQWTWYVLTLPMIRGEMFGFRAHGKAHRA